MFLIASTWEYLHSDWLTRVQYCSCCTLNIALRDGKNSNTRLPNYQLQLLNSLLLLQ